MSEFLPIHNQIQNDSAIAVLKSALEMNKSM